MESPTNQAAAGPRIVAQSAEVRAIVRTWKPLMESAVLRTADVLARLDFGPTTWSRILSDTYGAELPAERARQIDAVLHELADAKRSGAVLGRGGKFHVFSEHELLERVIKHGRANVSAGDEHRLVWFLARPGFGKDATQAWLAERDPNTVRLEARPSWRDSYLAVLHSMCEAVGVDVMEERTRKDGSKHRKCLLWNVRLAESALFAELKQRSYTLCFNEVSQMSAQLFRLIKSLVNDTAAVVVIFATPEYFAFISGQAARLGERDHLTRRSAGMLVEAQGLNAARVLKFAEGEGLAGTLSLPGCDYVTGTGYVRNGRVLSAHQWAETVAAEARAFGGYDLVRHAIAGLKRAGSEADEGRLLEAMTVFRAADVKSRRKGKGKGKGKGAGTV